MKIVVTYLVACHDYYCSVACEEQITGHVWCLYIVLCYIVRLLNLAKYRYCWSWYLVPKEGAMAHPILSSLYHV